MTGHECAPSVPGRDDVDTGLVRFGQYNKIGYALEVRAAYLGMARVRCGEDIVEAAHQLVVAIEDAVMEDAKHLLGQQVLGNSVAMVQSGLRAPTYIQGSEHVGFSPIKDVLELRPVIHLCELQLLHRRAGDDQPIELLTANLGKRFVMVDQVLFRRV